MSAVLICREHLLLVTDDAPPRIVELQRKSELSTEEQQELRDWSEKLIELRKGCCW